MNEHEDRTIRIAAWAAVVVALAFGAMVLADIAGGIRWAEPEPTTVIDCGAGGGKGCIIEVLP